MRRANCQGAMQYVPELTWILFLRILDEMETKEAENAEMQGIDYRPSLESPYRWFDWAAPCDEMYLREHPAEVVQGWKRYHLSKGTGNDPLKIWINRELIPHLKNLENKPNAS